MLAKIKNMRVGLSGDDGIKKSEHKTNNKSNK
jgi:hypothetical protein